MTARGIHSCCPEAPSTINITQNIVQLDGETTIFMDEQFMGSSVVGGLLTLSKTPYAAASVYVALNSGLQRQGVDYNVVNNKLFFLFDVAVSAVIHVKYMAVGDGVSINTVVGSGLTTGTIVGYGAAGIAPDGWVLMDGATKVYDTAYAALFAFLAAHLHLTDGTGEHTDGTGDYYVLKSVATSYFDGSAFVTGNTIIKT